MMHLERQRCSRGPSPNSQLPARETRVIDVVDAARPVWLCRKQGQSGLLKARPRPHYSGRGSRRSRFAARPNSGVSLHGEIMGIDQVVALVSLVLSIFFWWNARQQSAAAERTLQEIKSQIIGWQNELNKTAIEMLASRPEMIAMRTALAGSDSESNFSNKMADLVERLALSDDPNKAALVEAILTNHAGIILESQRIGMAAANARGNPPSSS